MRECADFWEVRGDIGFLNGSIGLCVDETLFDALILSEMVNLVTDVFYLGDDNEIPPDKALSNQVKTYLKLGTFDKNNVFTACPTNDDFCFSFGELEQEDVSNPEIGMEKALTLLLRNYSYPEKLPIEVKEFIRQSSRIIGMPDHIYYSDRNLDEQLRDSTHFPLVPVGSVFFVYDNYVLMITAGYDD